MKTYLSDRFRREDKLHVVSNGFDADDLADVQPINYGHFSIVYAGSFYIPISTAGTIMAVLKCLKGCVSDGVPGWRFHYYGGHGAHVEEEARKYDVLDRVTIHGVVSRREVHSAIRGANVAMVIASVNANPTLEEKGIVTGKLFEPLGLGTPVMLIAPDDNDASRIVRATGVGRQFAGSQTEEMASFLKAMMTAGAARAPIPREFSWQAIAVTLDNVLSGVRLDSAG